MHFDSCEERPSTTSSSQMTGNREIGTTKGLRNEACEAQRNPYIKKGSRDEKLSSEALRHDSQQRIQVATFRNTGKLADATSQKTPFHTCSSQLSEEAGEPPNDNWCSPAAHPLPLMPQIKPQERNNSLRSLHSDWFYTNGMTMVPMLQNQASHNVMLTSGISHRSPTNYLDEIYSSRTDQWTLFHPMPKALMGMAVVTVDNSIWIFGGLTRGSEGSSIEDGTYVFDPRMNAPLRSAEIYSSRTDQWTLFHPMPKALMGMAVVTVDNSIWIFGGLTRGSEGSSIEDGTYVFDPRMNALSLGLRITPKLMSSGFPQLKQMQQPGDPRFPLILVIGGLDPRNPLDSGTTVLKYHPLIEDRWTLVNLMPELRSYHGAAHINDTIFVAGSGIYIFGGINSQERGVLSKSTLVITDRKAIVSARLMPQPLSGHASVTLLPTSSQHPLSSSKWSDEIYKRHNKKFNKKGVQE
nr:alpha-scruin-like [Rhipicephalus microplus]